jgi:hypothetical protein
MNQPETIMVGVQILGEKITVDAADFQLMIVLEAIIILESSIWIKSV